MNNDLRDFADMTRPESGCTLAKEYNIFKGIFVLTQGNPCPGCGFNDGCKFLEKQKTEEKQRRTKNFGKVNFETNAQIAERLSKKLGREITSRQVSKMRKRGDWSV